MSLFRRILFQLILLLIIQFLIPEDSRLDSISIKIFKIYSSVNSIKIRIPIQIKTLIEKIEIVILIVIVIVVEIILKTYSKN